MPELPEVETIVRDLSSVLNGQKVIKAAFYNTTIREVGDYKSPSVLNGKILKRIDRFGKNIVFMFSDSIAMICHLKMTGRLIVNPQTKLDKKHIHFYIEFDRNVMNFHDVRKFGRICLIKQTNLHQHSRLGKLGPEPFDIAPDDFASRLKARNKPLKIALLDQEIVAGLGNIYADESLFEAGIRPDRRATRVALPRLRNLHAATIKVLNKAIKNRGTSVDDYLDGFGQSGNFQNLLNVYGKKDQPCPRCGKPLSRIVLGGRSTHYCSKCQK